MSLQLEANNIAMGILLLENSDATFLEFNKRSVFKLTDSWNEAEWNKGRDNYFKNSTKEEFKQYLIGRHEREKTTNKNYIK
jgi:hypothetical protein